MTREVEHHEAMAIIESMSHWDSHPEYPVEDWRYEVANDDTRESYKGWLYNRLLNDGLED